MIKLNIPEGFKRLDPFMDDKEVVIFHRAPSSFRDEPPPKLDLEEKLKQWKQMQTSKGAISSMTQLKDEIWNYGTTAIMSLLQTAIEVHHIQG